jgi:hypothetical protein
MLGFKKIMILAASAVMASACARGMQGSAAGDYIDPVEAAKTVTLEVQNDNPNSMELRIVVNDQSYFVGSVGGAEKTSMLLDPRFFPSGFIYVVGIPADARGRAIAGPLSAAKGDKIRFSISPSLDLSRATVVR